MPDKPTRGHLGPAFWLPVAWIAVVVLSATTAGWWPLPAFDAMDWERPSAPPGSFGAHSMLQHPAGSVPEKTVYWLGTDTMGRDMLCRLIYGARISLSVGLISPLIGFFAGGLLGCLAGYYRGRVDAVTVAVNRCPYYGNGLRSRRRQRSRISFTPTY